MTTRTALGRWLDGSMLRKSVAAVVLPMLLLVVAVVAIARLEQQTARAEQDVRRTLQVLSDLHEAHSLLAETAAAVRGYRLVRRDNFLDPYRQSEPRLRVLLARLQREITDPAQAARMARVTPLFEEKMLGWRELLAPGISPDAERLQLISGKDKLDVLRAELRTMREYETSQLDLRVQTAQRLRQRNLVITQAATVLAGLGAIAAVAWFTAGLARRARRLATDAARLGEGEALIAAPRGHDELDQVAARLADASRLLAERGNETRRAREEAEAANRAKTEFLSRSSHELRTPLNAILGYAQVLEQDLGGHPGHAHAQRIASAGRHLLGLISELLDIARIEAGRIDLAPEPVDVARVLDEALTLVRPGADARGVQLQVAPGITQVVEADPQRLRQVLVNLLSNAIKFNRPQGRVEVAAHVVADGVRIEVRDDGPGIPPERRARLFVPFERLGAERSAVEGTGLGLALSKRLVEAMDGTIGVDDVATGGACAWLVLPAARDVPVASAAQGAPSERAPDRARRVLSVEDNPSNQALVETLLARRAGWDVAHADSLAAARAALQGEAPDLLLVDLHLPDGRGEELIAEVRAIPALAHLPVVAVTADATAATLQAARAAGADAVITKPIDVPHFHATLRQVLA